MAKWNTDNPKVGNQVSGDIPDIEENFQELHDVIEAITDGTLGTTEPADFNVKSTFRPIHRAKFLWKDADEIYIDPGCYYHDGTTKQLLYWDSQLTFAFANLANSDWSYLYLDDSAIVTAGTNLITATELIDATTEPAWSDSKHGWYNGEDLCIFAVRTDGSGDILEFFHDGDLFVFADAIADYSGTPSNTWTNATLTIPKFTQKALINVDGTYSNATTEIRWRTDGQTATTGHECGILASTAPRSSNSQAVITSTSQIIEVRTHNASTNTVYVDTDGYFFPNTI